MSRNWIIAGVAAVCFVMGVALSHRIEPGVRVEKVMLTANTPAIRLFPATPGPHPIALLGHGMTGSKETLFRYGEALAAAGFDSYCVDFPGHGQSPQRFSFPEVASAPAKLAQSLGSVDVYLGHSLGAGAGMESVREAGFHPKLFIALGADVDLGERGPPLLLLAGLFEEFFAPAQLRARTNAQVIISPWSDHLLEAWDPKLVSAAVHAACRTVGKTPPAAATTWRWRFAGLVLALAGALGLMFCLPELHPRLARARGFLIPAILIITLILTTETWIGAVTSLRRVPLQLVLAALLWFALAGVGKFHVPRWSILAVTAILALGCWVMAWKLNAGVSFGIMMCVFGMSMLLLCPALIVAQIATCGGSRRDGDIAMAIFASYVIGQYMPPFY